MFRRLNFEDLPIRYKLLVAHLAILIGAALVGSLILYAVVRRTIEANIENELANSTASIFNMVRTAVSVSVKNRLRGVAEKNREIAAYFWQRHQDGRLSRDEAVAQIREVFLAQSIGKTGYLYCLNSQGWLQVHPRHQLEGSDVSMHGFVQDQIHRREGYIEYMWQNPGEDRPRPKALYMTYFEPLDWIISVSAYREEFADLISVADFRSSLMALRFGQSGYAFVIDTQGNVIIHPRLDSGVNLIKMPLEGVDTAAIETMIRQRTGKMVYAWKNPGEIEARQKLVLYDYLPELNWIVASSSYLDELYAPLAQARTIIMVTVVVALLLVVPLTFWIGARITGPLKVLMQRLSSASHDNFSLQSERSYKNDEPGRLARFVDDFMGRIAQSQADLNAEIAERTQVEQALRSREAEMRALLDNLPDMAWLKDMEGRIRIANRKFAEFWRKPPEALAGLTDTDLCPDPEMVTKFRRSDQTVIQKGKALRFEAPQTGFDGRERWYETLKSPIFDDSGRIVGTLGISRDITERKQTERQIFQVQKMEAVATLAGGVAHDFNNLLGGVLGNVNLIQMTLPPEDPNQARLKTIEKVVISGAHLARQLLSFARGGKYEARPVDLNSTVADALDLFARTCKRVRIHKQYEARPWTVKCDETQIEQVLLNICDNAADAMPDGGDLFIETQNVTVAEPVAAVHAVKSGPFFQIRIRDTGHGMPPEVRARVFEPFFSTKEIGKGTGLGLASAYGIVENHVGFIELESTIGQGTEIRVLLPADDRSVRDAPLATAHRSAPNGKRTILLVDDEPTFLEVSEEMLTVLGYRVVRADNGRAALSQFEQMGGVIDLVILDIIMPGMDGAETFQRLKAMDPSVKVLLASGYSKDGDVARILANGAAGFIEKPFRLHELSRKIISLLQEDTT